MATPFQIIYDRFIKRLKNDEQFLNYKGLNDQEIEQVVNDHLDSLLERSIEEIYKFGLPDANLYDRDDVNKLFNFDLIPQEISLLSELMYLCYFQEERNKLKVFSLTFRGSELDVFSPANDRKTFLEMLNKLESDAFNSISNYLSRDRLTWTQKSIYQNNISDSS
ncbi:hypothetical protein [Paenibacillus xylaniclasticus]|uniref:hypothetical protein n=1 Tax=Paenibacillus xylaniclasticus TaxID=588083 RepID=UPI000FD925A2|nr:MULTISPECIES: hypothetical protein [Paenibacillus]GFN32596.1 hypothetical protein PCURB6_28560 [Paenibacillus curdlanolyticus]